MVPKQDPTKIPPKCPLRSTTINVFQTCEFCKLCIKSSDLTGQAPMSRLIPFLASVGWALLQYFTVTEDTNRISKDRISQRARERESLTSFANRSVGFYVVIIRVVEYATL